MCRERSDVWGFLKAHGIRELPVHGRELAQEMQIQIIDYEVGAVLLHRLGLDELKARKEGFSVQTENHAYIFMRRGLSKARENHIILHEIGHFAAGHNDLLAHAAEKRTAAEERAAEEYVYEMAPTPVLYAAGFTTLEDIRRITGLEASTARRILTRVAEYTHRQCREEERQILKQFWGFIRKQRRRNRREHLPKFHLPILAGSLLLLACLGLLFIRQTPPQPSAEIPAQTVQTSQTAASSAGETVTGVVYWTEQGSVYHVSRTCQYIRDRKDEAVQSGGIEQARAAGKERACKICGNVQPAG